MRLLIDMAPASTRCDTHAPFATNVSAAATLPRVIACDEADKKVGVNGSHDVV